MQWIAPLVAGLGIGTLLTTVANHFMTRRANLNDRLHQEKREAYLGLLKSIHDAAVSPSDANSKAYALWQNRCDLFGSQDVATYAQEFADTNDSPRDVREKVFRNLVAAMKSDLGR